MNLLLYRSSDVMYPCLIISILLRTVFCRIPYRDKRKRMELIADAKGYVRFFHTILKRGNRKPDTAKSQRCNLQQDILRRNGKINLTQLREMQSFRFQAGNNAP